MRGTECAGGCKPEQYKCLGQENGNMAEGINGSTFTSIGAFARAMNGKNVFSVPKRGLRNSIFLPSLMYGSETWTWNRMQQSGV